MKRALYEHCQTYVAERMQRIQKTIAGLQESLSSETKSSVGDKHETGRAMVQLEREKVGRQLAEVQKLEKVLQKINPEINSTIICLGSVIYTNQASYYLAISAGEIHLGDNSFYAIGTHTPIGKLLLGKSVDDEINFNGKTIRIEKVD